MTKVLVGIWAAQWTETTAELGHGTFGTLGRSDRCFEGRFRAGMLALLSGSFQPPDCEALLVHKESVEQVYLLGDLLGVLGRGCGCRVAGESGGGGVGPGGYRGFALGDGLFLLQQAIKIDVP